MKDSQPKSEVYLVYPPLSVLPSEAAFAGEYGLKCVMRENVAMDYVLKL